MNRHLLVVVVIALIVAVSFVGCGDDDRKTATFEDSSARPPRTTDCPAVRRSPPKRAPTTRQLVGRSPPVADRLARARGYYVIPAWIDGKHQILPANLDARRIRVAVRKGRIIRVLGRC